MAPRSCPLDSFLDASPPRTPFLCRSYRYLHAGRVRFGAGSGRASSEKARSDRRHSTVTENLSTRLVEHYLNPPAIRGHAKSEARGREHVGTRVTNAPLDWRLQVEQKRDRKNKKSR